MKNLILMLFLFSSSGYANETLKSELHNIATCSYQEQEGVVQKFEVINLGGPDQRVKVTGALEPREIPAKNYLFSWINYRSEFELDGKKISLTFSNYLSPSIGQIAIDSKIEPIACQLEPRPTTSAKVDENNADFACMSQCGRPCLAKPIFCGGW